MQHNTFYNIKPDLQDGGMASKLTKLEQLALLVASLCHDLDHRGTNNAFQLK